MKKVILSLAVLFSVAMVSCGGNKANENAEEANAPEAVEVVEEVAAVNDSTPAGDSTAVEAAAAGAEEAPAEAPAENAQ